MQLGGGIRSLADMEEVLNMGVFRGIVGTKAVTDPKLLKKMVAEMLACVIDCFKAAGLEKFQVEIGHNGFMRCLLKDLDLDEEIRLELLELIEAKNFYGADEVLEQAGASKESREIFRRLSVCFGSIEKIAELKQVTEDPELISYIEYLEKLYSILSYYKLESYV